MNPEQSAARRWPPVLALITAGILVLLVLPNPLRVPNNNPAATAEYAPVPGKAQDAQNANFGETQGPSSAGIGSGGNGSGSAPAPQVLPPPQFKPRQKACFGNPPRQTEDPLSPPCVPFFDGDNGGNTFQGVTKDEIKVIFYNGSGTGVTGDLNTPYQPSQEKQCTTNAYECTNLVKTIKALRQYFQTRYQTYGRTVHLYGQVGSGAQCSAQNTDADTAAAEQHPFANVFLGDNDECYSEHAAKAHQILSFGLNFDVKRANYENFRPFIWGFFPDQETEASFSASFICRKLYLDSSGKPGNTAKFAQDTTLNGKPRKFGFIRPHNSQRGPSFEEVAALLQQELIKQCPRPGFPQWFDYVDSYDASGAGSGKAEAGGIMEKYKTNNVTTIVCYCIPVETEVTVPTMQNAANGIAYYPEWYWDSQGSAMDRAIWDQTHGSASQQGIGTSVLWRAPAFYNQYHYQAYLQEEPGTQPNVRFNFNIYHLFLNLFEAIQAAGPNLTPATVEQGMFTFTHPQLDDPDVPTGGYGPYNSYATATYNFVDTAMGWWYDPKGSPPGGRQGEGCIKVMNQGRRYYTGQWPLGDGDLVRPGDPCTVDTRKLVDPGHSTGT